MLLQRLAEYASRLALPPALYGPAPVRYILELDSAGHLRAPHPTDTADPAHPRTRRGQVRLVPQVRRGSGTTPLLLVDNATYTFGLTRPGSDAARAASAHAAYLDLLARCAAATGDPGVQAVAHFLAADPLTQLALPADFDPAARLTFRVGEIFPVDHPAVQTFWAAEHRPVEGPGTPAPPMQCLVCGQVRPVLRRWPTAIRGLPGEPAGGAVLISADSRAFQSYDLAASLVAPVCAGCAEQVTQALNALLADDTRRTVLGVLAVVCWTRATSPFSLRTFLLAPDPAQVLALLHRPRCGRPAPPLDDTAFYTLALTTNGGRAVVRDWLDTTLGAVQQHLAAWFARQAIVGAYGGDPTPLGLPALAAATVRDPRADPAPATVQTLLHAALTGTPLPQALLAQAIWRNRVEQSVTRPRAALIKLVLCSQPAVTEQEITAMTQLDPDTPDPAYRCGRLLAVLERIQRLAVPGIRTTLVDRFYGTASSAPASVFGRLLRDAQSHLATLARDRPAAHRALQRRLEEIQAGLPDFPRTLTLPEQGRFALGYYHQRAADRAAAADRADSIPPAQEDPTHA